MKIDKQEKLKKNKSKFEYVDNILQKEFKDIENQRGVCHLIWARKKELLKECFNIDWQSPIELNPEIIFD